MFNQGVWGKASSAVLAGSWDVQACDESRKSGIEDMCLRVRSLVRLGGPLRT